MQAQGAERATTLDIDNDKYPPRYYYTHDSIKSIKFAYPIPSREEVGCGSLPQPADNSNGRYLCGSTRRAFFGLNILEADDYYHSSHDIIDLESPGVKAGRLWPDKAFSDASVRLVELVAVSLKYCAENRKRWEQPFGGEIPQLYNVLWIEWLDGVAYRKGVGEVKRAVWETRAVESIELILG